MTDAARGGTPTFVELARTAARAEDVTDVLMLIGRRAVELLPVTACGILVRDAGGLLRVVSASSPAVTVLEVLDAQRDDGPGATCVVTGEPVRLGGDGAAERWPRLAAILASAGFTELQVMPLLSRRVAVGVLSLLGTQELGEDDRALAQALADVAALALLRSDAAEDPLLLARRLQEAAQAHATIAQAVGVVAERFGLDPERALGRLWASADAEGSTLVALARDVVARRSVSVMRPDVAAEDH